MRDLGKINLLYIYIYKPSSISKTEKYRRYTAKNLFTIAKRSNEAYPKMFCPSKWYLSNQRHHIRNIRTPTLEITINCRIKYYGWSAEVSDKETFYLRVTKLHPFPKLVAKKKDDTMKLMVLIVAWLSPTATPEKFASFSQSSLAIREPSIYTDDPPKHLFVITRQPQK